jgi:unsaturated rhamnogalacturonyl hydrolase
MPYVRGEREYYANFPHYFCGGNASAWLMYRGHLPEAEEPVRHYAEHLMTEQPRDSHGIYKHPAKPEEERIWIDVAFAVSPFLLFAGLYFDEPRYIQEAWEQTAKMTEALRCEETGLFYQCRGFLGPGKLSDDHWGRGNGWGAYALTELARYLPEEHPAKSDAIRLYRDHMEACARVQGENDGLWRQEMLEPTRAYVETSGSGLLLYAIGAGLEAGLLDADLHRPRFEKGLRNLVPYVTDNGDVFHCCKGCLCPGDGSKTAYRAMPPVYNDCHAFGPMVLAFGQANLLGFTSISETS